MPSSVAMWEASWAARRRWAGSVRQVVIAALRDAAVSSWNGSGRGAAPRRWRRAAQNGWSAMTGTGTAGTPARSPAAVVPAPAWWTTAAVRGNSQSCGRSPAARTSSPTALSPARHAEALDRFVRTYTRIGGHDDTPAFRAHLRTRFRRGARPGSFPLRHWRHALAVTGDIPPRSTDSGQGHVPGHLAAPLAALHRQVAGLPLTVDPPTAP